MQPKALHRFVWFGTCIRYLGDVKQGRTYAGSGYVKNNIESFFDYVEELGLTVTKNACFRLTELKSELDKRSPEKLTEADAKMLAEIMKQLRFVALAELSSKNVYIVTERRYKPEMLLDDPSRLFGAAVWDKLSEGVQKDFSEAARCLAFERSTATAFHILRGLERLIKERYCEEVKRNRVDLMWGAMITHLRSRKKLDKTLLDHLDNIRVNFRNPTQHPEKSYEIDEAQDLFGVSIDVVNRMCAEMK